MLIIWVRRNDISKSSRAFGVRFLLESGHTEITHQSRRRCVPPLSLLEVFQCLSVLLFMRFGCTPVVETRSKNLSQLMFANLKPLFLRSGLRWMLDPRTHILNLFHCQGRQSLRRCSHCRWIARQSSLLLFVLKILEFLRC